MDVVAWQINILSGSPTYNIIKSSRGLIGIRASVRTNESARRRQEADTDWVFLADLKGGRF